jgi:intein/homing endonuclease
MIKNTNKFRQAALHFQQYGYYTSAPKGTSAYKNYWDEETKRCLNGYIAEDDDYITGYNYFYLNYCPIMVTLEIKTDLGNDKTRVSLDRVREFPSFFDSDYDYFIHLEEAERLGKHVVVLKARGKGYSFKGSSMLCRNFYLIPESKSYAIASESEFLTKDGLLTKAWDLMSWIDQNTAWTKKRQKIDTKMHKRASYIVNSDGTMIEGGIMSEIMGVTLKNDPQKARGKRGKLILWEEAGVFPGLKAAWQIARPSVEDGGRAFGLMIAYGTGGTEGADYDSLKDLFYEPEAYNVHSVPNIWDEGATKNCGFFVAEYSNLFGVDEQGRPFMDKDGNTIKEIAIPYIFTARQKIIDNATDRTSIDRYIAERPLNPMEATLQLSGNIFPKKDLTRHLAHIRNSETIKDYRQIGELFFDVDSKIKWKQDKKFKDLRKYRLEKGDSRDGAITIWEHPMDKPPYGLYIAGCLTPGEKVITIDGLKNVEDVTLEDNLINKDGREVSINTLLRYDKVDEPTYKVKMSNIYRTTNYTQEHPLYLSTTPYNTNLTIEESKFKFDFIRARDIKKGMWTKYPNIYKKNKFYTLPFKVSDEDYFWWFIGLWLGDGWVDDDKIYISFNKAEQIYIDYMYSFANDVLDRKPYSRIRGNCVEVSFGYRELSKFLTSTFGKGALNKKLPEWIKFIPYDYKCNLIQGYLDSDGCITRHTKGYYSTEFVSISQELLEGFQDILFSIGIVSNMNLLRDNKYSNIRGVLVKQMPTWHLRLSHHSTLQLVKELPFTDDIKIKRIDFNNLPNVRKRPKDGCFISEDREYIYLQIKDIEESTYTGTVYNFDCETHTFITQYCTGHNCDPYDHDKSGGDSLGSIFIYKRFQTFEYTFDTIVAEYTGRPDTAELFYEKVRTLLMYYNASVLYENQWPGLSVYMRNKHCDYLLADQPDIISKIIRDSRVQRGKGIHMNTQIKDWAEGRLRDWLIEEYEPGKKNLTKIFSEPLLEELIAYNDKGNFDRVIAMFMIMLYKEELHDLHVKAKETTEKSKKLFESPLFGDMQFNTFN